MASTTTYGDFPGVRITTAGGAITGVAVGREQKLVLVGNGAPDDGSDSTGSADANVATQIAGRLDADRKFGDDTELAEQVKDAIANGANIDYLYGVMWETTESTETFTAESGTLSEAPIIEDKDAITVTLDGGAGDEAELVFNFDKPPADPGLDDDTAYVNPITGEFVVDSVSGDYEIVYSYPDIESALAEAETVIGDEETGIIAPLVESENVATDLSGLVNTLRGEYQLAMGLQAAEPTGTMEDTEQPFYDTGNYADSIDNDAMFLHAPARKEASDVTVTGALAGLLAGAALGPGGSVYRSSITVDNLEQRLSNADSQNLRDAQVLPVRQPPQGGSVVLEDNLSTSTETDWVRDYWRRRIVDQVILIAKSVGDSIIGRINDERTRDTVETTIMSELNGLAGDRLITTDYFVEVYQVDTDTVGIDLGITPQGIAKRVDISITIDA